MKILHMLSQRPECTGSGFFFQAMIRESSRLGHLNHAICGVTENTIPHEKIFSGATRDFIFFNGKDINYPVAGMSDVMPYENTRFSDLTPDQLSNYKNVFSEKTIKTVNDFSPDLILSHHLWIMSSIVKKAFPNIPVATISHGTDLRQIKNCPQITRDIIHDIQNIDIVYALSKQHKKDIYEICSIPESRIFVSGSGYNDSLFKFTKKPDTETINILFAGKLARAKGVPWLLKTIKALNKLPFHLYLAGSGTGEDFETCMKLANDNRKKVTMLGTLSQENLAEYMQKSHIFILPSFFEGLPLVILEALACGCRVITTDLHGAAELAGNDSRGLIEFIKLPELETIDKPFLRDLPDLEKDLGEKIEEMISLVKNQPIPNIDKIEKLISPYKWSEVYSKVDSSFRQIIE